MQNFQTLLKFFFKFIPEYLLHGSKDVMLNLKDIVSYIVIDKMKTIFGGQEGLVFSRNSLPKEMQWQEETLENKFEIVDKM